MDEDWLMNEWLNEWWMIDDWWWSFSDSDRDPRDSLTNWQFGSVIPVIPDTVMITTNEMVWDGPWVNESMSPLHHCTAPLHHDSCQMIRLLVDLLKQLNQFKQFDNLLLIRWLILMMMMMMMINEWWWWWQFKFIAWHDLTWHDSSFYFKYFQSVLTSPSLPHDSRNRWKQQQWWQWYLHWWWCFGWWLRPWWPCDWATPQVHLHGDRRWAWPERLQQIAHRRDPLVQPKHFLFQIEMHAASVAFDRQQAIEQAVWTLCKHRKGCQRLAVRGCAVQDLPAVCRTVWVITGQGCPQVTASTSQRPLGLHHQCRRLFAPRIEKFSIARSVHWDLQDSAWRNSSRRWCRHRHRQEYLGWRWRFGQCHIPQGHGPVAKRCNSCVGRPVLLGTSADFVQLQAPIEPFDEVSDGDWCRKATWRNTWEVACLSVWEVWLHLCRVCKRAQPQSSVLARALVKHPWRLGRQGGPRHCAMLGCFDSGNWKRTWQTGRNPSQRLPSPACLAYPGASRGILRASEEVLFKALVNGPSCILIFVSGETEETTSDSES